MSFQRLVCFALGHRWRWRDGHHLSLLCDRCGTSDLEEEERELAVIMDR